MIKRFKYCLLLAAFIFLFKGSVFGQTKPAEIIEYAQVFQVEEVTILNSAYRETNFSITPDGNTLYFMSDRGEQPWSEKAGKYKRKVHFDGDLWMAVRENGEWQMPICLDSTINTYSGEDEPWIAPDGQTVVFQSWKDDWKQTGGPYYMAELSGDQWSNPVGLGGGINKFFIGKFNRSEIGYATDGATLSPDGNTFIVACGEDYDGNMDFYMSKKIEEEWGAMQKLTISTPADERSVFLAADGETIYFASDGYTGFGGLDIFKTTMLDNGRFGPVQNIGTPFNTPDDDYGFFITASEQEAYFSRNGDVFRVVLDEDDRVKPKPILLISGILSGENGAFIEAHLDLIDARQKKVLASSKSNALTGKYSFAVPLKSNTLLIQDREKHLVDTTFMVQENSHYQHLEIDLKAKTLALETTKFTEVDSFSIGTNFAFDKFELDSADLEKLKHVIEITRNAANYKIEVAGHTDNVGDEAYNMELGLQRAMAIKMYLIENAVDERRIVVTSQGEHNPVFSNDTDIGKSKNRWANIVISYTN